VPHRGPCVAHSNYPRSCVKCGRLLVHAPDVLPEALRQEKDSVPGMPRDAGYERELIAAAARAWGVDGSRVAELAHTRAHDGPVGVAGRDLPWEAIEEAADGCNYIAWEMRRLGLHRSDDLQAGEAHAHLGHALGAFAFAFHELQQARALLKG
jgi:hypothetical protein